GVLFAHVTAGNQGDEAGVLLYNAAGQTVGGLGDVGADVHDLAVLHGHDLALLDLVAVEVAVAGGEGHKTGAHLTGGVHHVDGVGVHGGVRVKAQHGGDALGNGAG